MTSTDMRMVDIVHHIIPLNYFSGII